LKAGAIAWHDATKHHSLPVRPSASFRESSVRPTLQCARFAMRARHSSDGDTGRERTLSI
jgi:hypothetical protein